MRNIDVNARALFSDSLELDSALRGSYPSGNRWDNLLGHKDSLRVVGLEPHSAENSEVDTVIRKRQAAMRQLAGHLRDGKRVKMWFWVASGKIQCMPFDTKILKLSENGITFVGRALGASHLKSLIP